jgi:hypothetical protein
MFQTHSRLVSFLLFPLCKHISRFSRSILNKGKESRKFINRKGMCMVVIKHKETKVLQQERKKESCTGTHITFMISNKDQAVFVDEIKLQGTKVYFVTNKEISGHVKLSNFT